MMVRRPLIERGTQIIQRRQLKDIDYDVLTVFRSKPNKFLTNSRILKEIRKIRENQEIDLSPRIMADVKKTLHDYGLIKRDRTSLSTPYKYYYAEDDLIEAEKETK